MIMSTTTTVVFVIVRIIIMMILCITRMLIGKYDNAVTNDEIDSNKNSNDNETSSK